MLARLSAFLIWALVAAAAVFWGMKLFVRTTAAPLNAVVVGETAVASGDFSRLLGADPVAAKEIAPAMSSRFRLLGVMAAKADAQGQAPGVALISIDGKPARAFVAGAQVDENLVLKTVSLRSASLGAAQGQAAFVLEVPALPPPATGVLPKVVNETLKPLPAVVPATATAPASAPAPRSSASRLGQAKSAR